MYHGSCPLTQGAIYHQVQGICISNMAVVRLRWIKWTRKVAVMGRWTRLTSRRSKLTTKFRAEGLLTSQDILNHSTSPTFNSAMKPCCRCLLKTRQSPAHL
eukprot:2883146-Amphidinium_carterae.1